MSFISRIVRPILILFGVFTIGACGAGSDKNDGREPITDTGSPTQSSDDRTVGGSSICSGGSASSDGTYTAYGCVGANELSPRASSTDGTYLLESGSIGRVAP